MNCKKCHASFEKEGKDPLLLPSCGHTLCRNCLRLFIQHNGFKCPFCGKKQPPNLNLGDLLPNYAILEMMENMDDEKGCSGRKKGRHRSRGRTAKDRERSVIRSTESECLEHVGVRLMYWCGPCGVAACGECVVEKHTGGDSSGGRRHQTVRIDTALKMRRSEVEELVIILMQTLEAAEKKHGNLIKSSPFISAARKLQTEVTAVMGKMRVVMSLLSRLIQETEEGNAGLRHLRVELDELIQKTPPSGSAMGSVSEIMALLKHLKEIEEFRDGAVAKVLEETEALGKEDRMIFFGLASAHSAVLNQKAAVLCKQLVLCSGGCHLDVVGGGGLLGSLTWERNKFHLHCLRLPSGPRRSTSDLVRCHALKWQVLQTQMQEVKEVFLDLAWGGQGQGAAGKERLYLKLCWFDSVSEASCRCFLHLVMGDDDDNSDGTTSLLGPLPGKILEVLGRAILLGTRSQKEGEGTGNKSTADCHPTASAVAPAIVDAGDLVCIKGRQGEEEAEFWLVTEGPTRIAKPPATYEVIGALLPAHKSLLAKLPSLKGMKVEDCGAIIANEKKERESPHSSSAAPSARVSPSVHTHDANKNNFDDLDSVFQK